VSQTRRHTLSRDARALKINVAHQWTIRRRLVLTLRARSPAASEGRGRGIVPGSLCVLMIEK
jgi:hypothetical protein